MQLSSHSPCWSQQNGSPSGKPGDPLQMRSTQSGSQFGFELPAQGLQFAFSGSPTSQMSWSHTGCALAEAGHNSQQKPTATSSAVRWRCGPRLFNRLELAPSGDSIRLRSDRFASMGTPRASPPRPAVFEPGWVIASASTEKVKQSDDYLHAFLSSRVPMQDSPSTSKPLNSAVKVMNPEAHSSVSRLSEAPLPPLPTPSVMLG